MDQDSVLKIWERLKTLFSNPRGATLENITRWILAGLIGFYLLFSFMIVRQVNLLTRFLGTSLSPWIKIFAWLYVLYCLSILLMVLGLF